MDVFASVVLRGDIRRLAKDVVFLRRMAAVENYDPFESSVRVCRQNCVLEVCRGGNGRWTDSASFSLCVCVLGVILQDQATPLNIACLALLLYDLHFSR